MCGVKDIQNKGAHILWPIHVLRKFRNSRNNQTTGTNASELLRYEQTF
jgi:hypothetical protein